MRMRALLLAFLQVVCSEFFIDDTILYKVDFPGLEETNPLGSENVEDMETYTLVSKNKEKYECFIPRVNEDQEKKDAKYAGESPVQLIEALFKQQQCVHRLESYWTYELCHGKYLRQYHEERAGKDLKLQEYFLGRYSMENLAQLAKEDAADKENDITRHPPTKKVQTLSMPYFEVTMEDGTVCDLNSEKRRTKILYMCYPTGRNEILSVKETSTCEYEVIVLTSALCTHPHFKPDEVTEHGIRCRPLHNSPAKPADLVSLESESSKRRSGRYWEAHFKTGSKPGQVKIEIRPSEAMEESRDTQNNENGFQATKIKTEKWREPQRMPFKPVMDAQIVKQFLKGEHCLVGGSGWWKYQFCYGKTVDQFHVDESGEKTVISLGVFDQDKHLKWIQEHPTKKPKPVDKRKFVSHLYSDGDACDLTGRPRHVEVKLKCKEADSPSVVSLYLLEPKTCQYVLGVESPLVCDILSHADPETGLMPLGFMDSIDKPVPPPMDLGVKEEKLEPVVNHSTFLSEIENAVRKIKDFKGRVMWEEKPDHLTDLEQEGVLTTEEKKRLAVLKDRIRRRKDRFGHQDSEHVVVDSLQDKKFYYSSSSRQETGGGTVKEDIFIVDGEKIKLQEVIMNGKIMSTRVIREREIGRSPEDHTSSSHLDSDHSNNPDDSDHTENHDDSDHKNNQQNSDTHSPDVNEDDNGINRDEL
jgi:endoplasmic reticulum lectin 1